MTFEYDPYDAGEVECDRSEAEENLYGRPDEPDMDDSVKYCPDCETPNQFGQRCPECEREYIREQCERPVPYGC